MLEPSTVLLAIAFFVTWVGFGLLALTQERHFSLFYLLFRPSSQWIRAQAAIGIIAILTALPLCVKAQSTSFGSLLWILLTTFTAMTVALQLTWAPQSLALLAWLVKRCFYDSFFQRRFKLTEVNHVPNPFDRIS